jgi:hypothetical protein
VAGHGLPAGHELPAVAEAAADGQGPDYTRPMPAERIAENLAYVNWTVLAGLAVGGFGAVALGRLRTDATRGYLTFIAICAAVFGLLAYLSDTGLPVGTLAAHGDPAWDQPRRLAMLLLTLSSAVYAVAIARGRRAPGVAALGLVAGMGALIAGALSWGIGPGAVVPLAIQLCLLAAATGGVFAAMILGHWYLVTPKLPEGPLILFSRMLLGIVALQVLLFGAWVATGTGGGGPFSALTGPWALFVWLRLLVGLAFPLVISWAAIQTARTRSMESATGLLYIAVGSIAAGTILAAGLYFGAGMLV